METTNNYRGRSSEYIRIYYQTVMIRLIILLLVKSSLHNNYIMSNDVSSSCFVMNLVFEENFITAMLV